MSPSQSRSEKIWGLTLALCAGFTACIVLGIVVFLIGEASPLWQSRGLESLTPSTPWNPSAAQFGLVPMLVGTLVTSLLGLLLASPLGILSALYSSFYAGPLVARLYRVFIQLLAGIPSVVYGFWGLVVIVPYLNHFNPPGASVLAGALVLAIMILPTIALIAESSFASISKQELYGAHALGMSRLGMIRSSVWPQCKTGVLGALILASGRAMGETMAIVMVAGNIVQIPSSIWDPVRTLTANIALEMAYAGGEHRAALFLSGLLLVLLVMALLLGFEWMRKRKRHA